jgi:hypothetical protein
MDCEQRSPHLPSFINSLVGDQIWNLVQRAEYSLVKMKKECGHHQYNQGSFWFSWIVQVHPIKSHNILQNWLPWLCGEFLFLVHSSFFTVRWNNKTLHSTLDRRPYISFHTATVTFLCRSKCCSFSHFKQRWWKQKWNRTKVIPRIKPISFYLF